MSSPTHQAEQSRSSSSSSSSSSLERVVPLEMSTAAEDSFSDELPSEAAAWTSLTRARRILYLFQFFYSFSEQVWSFGSALWLAALTDYTNLFWISAYSAIARVMVILMVPFLTSKIDESGSKAAKQSRLTLVSAWIIGQHIFVMATIVLIYVTLLLRQAQSVENSTDSNGNGNGNVNGDGNGNGNGNVNGDDHTDITNTNQGSDSQLLLSRLGLISICLCGGIAQVLHNVLQVAIERDWIVVMAEEAQEIASQSMKTDPSWLQSSSSPSSWLQDTNVALRQIYIKCQILGPLAMGFLLAYGDDIGLLVVFALKGISMVVICFCLHRLCELVPALKQTPDRQPPSPCLEHHETNETSHNSSNEIDQKEDSLDASNACDDEGGELSLRLSQDSDRSCWGSFCCCSDLKLYFSQKGLVGAGFGLALLYADVLTFGGMMIAYLVEKGGMSAASIGLWKGLSNVAAVLGTIWFSRTKLDLESKTLWSLVFQFACLTLPMAGIIIGYSSDSASAPLLGSALVIAGVIPSRGGLWGYDIGVAQLYQRGIEPSLRGTIGGTQTILNNAFEFVPFVMGMIFSGVEDFWILMVSGYICVGLALVSYVKWTYDALPRYKRVDVSAEVA